MSDFLANLVNKRPIQIGRNCFKAIGQNRQKKMKRIVNLSKKLSLKTTKHN